jgi:putative acetyltransferase
MDPFVIAADDPRADDVRELLARHLGFAREHSPPVDVHALDLDALLAPAISFFSARRPDLGHDRLLAIGALKQLDAHHGELKSMHTAQEARGEGVGRAMVDHLVDLARVRGYRRVSLETGSQDAFAPARRLYLRCGFSTCGPFGDYAPSDSSAFMTLAL